MSRPLVLSLLLLLLSPAVYLIATTPFHENIPPDPIYLSVGARLKENDVIQIQQFRFWVDLANDTIEIDGSVGFFTASRIRYFDFYLPFVVHEVYNESSTMRFDTTIYRDTVDGTCSLVHADIYAEAALHNFRFRIYVQELTAVKSFGEDRIILTFGYPSMSERFRSLEHHIPEGSVGISDLTPLTVTIVVGEQYFFSSNTYPPPDVEYLTSPSRIATWLIQFSGPLSGYYRSVDCTVTMPLYLQLRPFLILISGALMSLGFTILVRTYVPEAARSFSTSLWYLRMRTRHKILQAIRRLRR